MRRLRDFQSVTLSLGGVTTGATVSAVDRGVAQLDVHDAGVLAKLRLPMRTELSFVHRGHYVMLAGMLTREGDRRLTFMPDVRGLVPSRRTAARLQVGLAVRATLATGEVVDTKTVDVSASGVLLAHARLGRALDAVQLQITLPGDRGWLKAEGRIVRVGWSETALRFGRMEAADAATLTALVQDVRFSLAQRFTDQRATG
jgi:hypothetical protein